MSGMLTVWYNTLSSLWGASSDLSHPVLYVNLHFKCFLGSFCFVFVLCLFVGEDVCLGCLICIFLLSYVMPISGIIVELLERKQNVPALILLSCIIFSLNRIYL